MARGSSSTSRGPRGARVRRWGAAAALALLVWLGAGHAEKDSPEREAARVARENQLLQRQNELASEAGFYMVLDARDRTLRMMLQGVTLRRYEIRDLRIGVPRVLFKPLSPPDGWQDRVWSGPQLDPPRASDRLEIIATGDSTTMPEPPIPLTPEEKFPAPPSYRIRYQGGLSLEVRSVTAPLTLPDSLREDTGLLGRLRARVHEARSVLREDERDAVRVRVLLQGEDAAAIYRSMPPDTKLIILTHATGS